MNTERILRKSLAFIIILVGTLLSCPNNIAYGQESSKTEINIALI